MGEGRAHAARPGARGGDRFTLFYTGFEQTPDWARMLDEAKGRETCAVGLVELRLER